MTCFNCPANNGAEPCKAGVRCRITYNAKDANKEFVADCLIGALDIAIQTLEGEVERVESN